MLPCLAYDIMATKSGLMFGVSSSWDGVYEKKRHSHPLPIEMAQRSRAVSPSPHSKADMGSSLRLEAAYIRDSYAVFLHIAPGNSPLVL